MTETFRRELERLATQGHSDAAVRLIRTQLDAGGLTNERLELACFLGHHLSCTALGLPNEALTLDASQWVERLVSLCAPIENEPLVPGKAALLIACHAASTVALELVEDGDLDQAKDWGEFLQGMRGWLETPSQTGHVTVLACMPRIDHDAPAQTLPREIFVLMRAALAFKHLTTLGNHEQETLEQALRLDEQRVRRAVGEALIPWSLRGSSATV